MDTNRGVMNRIRRRARKYGFKNASVREFTLIMYAALTEKSNSLKFQTNLVNQAHEMECLLEKSDAFFTQKFALGIHKVAIDGGVEQPGNTPLFHYEDPNWFDAGGAGFLDAGTKESQAVGLLYNSGKLSLKTDTDVRQESLDCRKFRKVPETQYNPGPPFTWPCYDDDAIFEESPVNFGIWGNKRNEFNIEFANGDYANIAGDPGVSQNYAVLMVKGLLIPTAAEAITRSDAHQLMFKNL